MMRAAGRLVLVVAIAMSGCGGGGGDGAAATAADLPASCRERAPAQSVNAPEGLLPPRGADIIIERVKEVDGGVAAEGFISATPQSFHRLLNAARFDMVFSELDATDTEVMYKRGKWLNFWALKTACPEGSTFYAHVSRTPASR